MNYSLVRPSKYISPAILILKFISNNTPIDVGKNFGLRSVAQVRTSGKVRVAVGDDGEQLLPTTWWPN